MFEDYVVYLKFFYARLAFTETNFVICSLYLFYAWCKFSYCGFRKKRFAISLQKNPSAIINQSFFLTD